MRIVYKNNIKNLFFIIFIFLFLGCTKKIPEPSSIIPEPSTILAKNLKTDKNGLTYLSAILKTVHGDIEIKFYPKEAPVSVTRILDLISMGFYNGLNFHRVIPYYIIQAGDPTGTGSGGSGRNLIPEFNKIPHRKGTVALAKGKDPNSADSQFYIALTSLPHLDGKFTVIGQVISDLDILNEIKMGDEILSFTLKEK